MSLHSDKGPSYSIVVETCGEQQSYWQRLFYFFYFSYFGNHMHKFLSDNNDIQK